MLRGCKDLIWVPTGLYWVPNIFLKKDPDTSISRTFCLKLKNKHGSTRYSISITLALKLLKKMKSIEVALFEL